LASAAFAIAVVWRLRSWALFVLILTCAVLSRVNYVEWIFAPASDVQTAEIGRFHDVADGDMVIGVSIAGRSRATARIVVLLALFLGIWEAAFRLGLMSPIIFASPSLIAEAAAKDGWTFMLAFRITIFEITMAMLRSVVQRGQIPLPLAAGEPEIEALKKVLPDRPVLVSCDANRKEYNVEFAALSNALTGR
jgi:hypothetical protein